MSHWLQPIPPPTPTPQLPGGSFPSLPPFATGALTLTVGLLGASVALIALFVNRRSDIDQKYRSRIVEARAKIRARRYQPELRRLLRDLAREISTRDSGSALSEQEFEAAVGTAEVAQRIAVLNGYLAEENHLGELLDSLKDHQTRMLRRVFVAMACFGGGGAALLSAFVWPPGWESTLVGAYVAACVGALVMLGRAFFGQLNVENRLDRTLSAIEGQE